MGLAKKSFKCCLHKKGGGVFAQSFMGGVGLFISLNLHFVNRRTRGGSYCRWNLSVDTHRRRQHIEGTELVSTIDLLFGLKEGARGDKSARALFTSYTHATPFPTF